MSQQLGSEVERQGKANKSTTHEHMQLYETEANGTHDAYQTEVGRQCGCLHRLPDELDLAVEPSPGDHYREIMAKRPHRSYIVTTIMQGDHISDHKNQPQVYTQLSEVTYQSLLLPWPSCPCLLCPNMYTSPECSRRAVRTATICYTHSIQDRATHY